MPEPEPAAQRPSVSVAVGQHERMGRHPAVAAALGTLVALAVFALLWRFRKTFGVKS